MLLDVAHTRVHAGGFLLYRNGKQEGEEPEYYPDFERVLDVDMSALPPETMIEQEAIVREDLIEGLEIETRLGAGGYGTAYKAVLKHSQRAPKPLVVKIANAMLQHGIIREVFDVDTKKTKLRYNATIAKKCFDQIHKAREDLKKEYEYALQILAPRYYQLRYADEFYRLTSRSAQDFIAIQEEAKILRRHPGYNHLHKILHFNSQERCVDSQTIKEPDACVFKGCLSFDVGSRAVWGIINVLLVSGDCHELTAPVGYVDPPLQILEVEHDERLFPQKFTFVSPVLHKVILLPFQQSIQRILLV